MEFTKKDLNKTIWVKPEWLKNNREWYVVDASWKTLWRLAVEIAKKLQWKHKAHFSDSWDAWDFVVVTNAKKIKVTWNKLADKMYRTHSWYKWHLKEKTLGMVLENHADRVITHAVSWMLPKNKLRKSRLKRLKVFVENTDKYNDLNLKPLEINEKY